MCAKPQIWSVQPIVKFVDPGLVPGWVYHTGSDLLFQQAEGVGKGDVHREKERAGPLSQPGGQMCYLL